jgi:hypothetical protein
VRRPRDAAPPPAEEPVVRQPREAAPLAGEPAVRQPREAAPLAGEPAVRQPREAVQVAELPQEGLADGTAVSQQRRAVG